MQYLPRHVLSSREDLLRQPPFPWFSSESAYASPDCVATIKRFARQAGFSSTVAGQLTFFRRKSTRMNYQARWSTYGMWCAESGLRSSSLSISEIAEFLTFLFKRKGTALSTVKGYRAMLSAVFKLPFRASLPLISLTTSFGLLRFLLPGLFFSFLHLGIWMRF